MKEFKRKRHCIGDITEFGRCTSQLEVIRFKFRSVKGQPNILTNILRLYQLYAKLEDLNDGHNTDERANLTNNSRIRKCDYCSAKSDYFLGCGGPLFFLVLLTSAARNFLSRLGPTFIDFLLRICFFVAIHVDYTLIGHLQVRFHLKCQKFVESF